MTAGRSRPYDVAVIGGGINGAGIACDAALRGLDVLLLEARDFGGETSGWSTRLIHGGLRYLEYGELPLVYESLHERRRLLAAAPHLVKPLRLTIPVYRGARRGRFLIGAGMMLYDLLSLGKSLPRHDRLSASELLAAEPGLQPEGLTGGVRYYDAQVTYAERLVLENVLGAAAAGADVRNHAPVTSLRPAGAGFALGYRDPASGAAAEAEARAVINAAGPWVDAVLDLTGDPPPPLMGGTKGSHLVTGRFAGAPTDAVYVEARADGRPIFVVPWNDQVLIGTTDIRYDGDPADAVATDAEIDYLLAEANRVFPRAGLDRRCIHFTYAGVRPLPRREQGPESAITRRHIIRAHEGRWDGLYSIIGGKLTTYRNLAEQAVDRLVKRLPDAAGACCTRDTRLPGGEGLDAPGDPAEGVPALSAAGRDRLRSIYGARSRALCELALAEPALARGLDEAGTVLAAEVVFAIREEFARDLADIVYRRTMLGLDADGGAPLVPAITGLAAEELGWNEAERRRQLERLAAHGARLGRRAAG